jgi:hypothetical protein
MIDVVVNDRLAWESVRFEIRFDVNPLLDEERALVREVVHSWGCLGKYEAFDGWIQCHGEAVDFLDDAVDEATLAVWIADMGRSNMDALNPLLKSLEVLGRRHPRMMMVQIFVGEPGAAS